MTTAGFEPCVALLVEPVADFAKLSAQAVLLSLQHLAYTSSGDDGRGGELDEGVGRQRSAVVDVERCRRLDVLGHKADKGDLECIKDVTKNIDCLTNMCEKLLDAEGA